MENSDDGIVYMQSDGNIPQYTLPEQIEEAVTFLCYQYIEKNNGKKPSKSMINKMIADLFEAAEIEDE